MEREVPKTYVKVRKYISLTKQIHLSLMPACIWEELRGYKNEFYRVSSLNESLAYCI